MEGTWEIAALVMGDAPVIFLSWSESRSRNAAEILREFLPKLMPGIDVFMSEQDISKGTKGLSVISHMLEKSFFGIVCLTQENKNNPWVNFEAGALSKHVTTDRVSPLMLGVSISDIGEGPLSQFQATFFKKEDLYRLILNIAEQSGLDHLSRNLKTYFEMFWAEFEGGINKVINDDVDNGATKVPDRLEAQLDDLGRQLNTIQYKLNNPKGLLPEHTLVRALAEAGSKDDLAKSLYYQIDQMAEALQGETEFRNELAKIVDEIAGLAEDLESRLEDMDVSLDLSSDMGPDVSGIKQAVQKIWEMLPE